MESKKYIFKGFVQGVGFRSFVHYHALKLDVIGSVKNLCTGDVEVIASADSEILALFFTRIHKGPSGSHIEDIIEEDLTANQIGKGFRIL